MDNIISFTLSSGRVLELTRQHLLATWYSGFNFADHVQCGDLVSVTAAVADDNNSARVNMIWETVSAIDKIQRAGVFSPLTISEVMLVGGVQVPCYGDLKYHALSHLAMSGVRVFTDSIARMTSVCRQVVRCKNAFTSSPPRPFVPDVSVDQTVWIKTVR